MSCETYNWIDFEFVLAVGSGYGSADISSVRLVHLVELLVLTARTGIGCDDMSTSWIRVARQSSRVYHAKVERRVALIGLRLKAKEVDGN